MRPEPVNQGCDSDDKSEEDGRRKNDIQNRDQDEENCLEDEEFEKQVQHATTATQILPSHYSFSGLIKK